MNTMTKPGVLAVMDDAADTIDGFRLADTVESRSEAIALREARATVKRLAEALADTLVTCISRGTKLGLDDGGPVLDKARAALAAFRGEASP